MTNKCPCDKLLDEITFNQDNRITYKVAEHRARREICVNCPGEIGVEPDDLDFLDVT